MESKHISRNVNVSIRKVRMFIPTIKKLSPVLAMQKLDFLPHSGAKALLEAIKTATANATSTLKVAQDMLKFKNVFADQGLVLKRYRAGSRGSPLPIKRRMTHITVVMGVAEQKPVQVKKASTTEQKDSQSTKDKKKTVKKTAASKKVTKSKEKVLK